MNAPRALRVKGRLRRDERGVALVLTALMVVAVALLAALVVDLGQLRSDRRANKGVADAAARAGISRLPYGVWAGACQARRYLLSSAKGFTAFDAGSETWSDAGSPPTVRTSSPCDDSSLVQAAGLCRPGDPTSFAKLQATARGGRFTVEIQAGYRMPDARFREDTGRSDVGDPAQDGCDNLSVVITQRRTMLFAPVMNATSGTSRVRSVGRLNSLETLDFVAALQLLDRVKCNVLVVNSNNVRVIAQPYNAYPGTIQVDSDRSGGDCSNTGNPDTVIRGKNTGTLKPSILACSTNSTYPDCQPGVGTRESRVGIYALNVRSDNVVDPYSAGTYGDTPAVPSPRTGRGNADDRYRDSVDKLDAQVQTMFSTSSGRPPGCGSVNGNDVCHDAVLNVDWLVVPNGQCSGNNLSKYFDPVQHPGRTAMQYVWFNCDLDISDSLHFTAASSYFVVNGKLSVNQGGNLTIDDPRKVYIYGSTANNANGVLVSSGTLNINLGNESTCSTRTAAGHADQIVVGNGKLSIAASGVLRMCQTFVLMSSGFGKVPKTNGTGPCLTTCATYSGTVELSGQGTVDWSAPNEIADRPPTTDELTGGYKFEDLALWTEAGGATNGLAGGGASSLAGVYFLPNAAPFTLNGGSSGVIRLSAQFIADTMTVVGNSTINLVPNPDDSIPTTIYNTLLVR